VLASRKEKEGVEREKLNLHINQGATLPALLCVGLECEHVRLDLAQTILLVELWFWRRESERTRGGGDLVGIVALDALKLVNLVRALIQLGHGGNTEASEEQ